MYKIINIKENLPNSEYAIYLAHHEIECAKLEGVDVLIVIHGYGSKGVGGVIKKELHKSLDELMHNGKIRAYIPGERWAEFNDEVGKITQKYPNLLINSELTCLNAGITVINVSL